MQDAMRAHSPPPGNFRPPHFARRSWDRRRGLHRLAGAAPPSAFGALSLPGIWFTILGIALVVSAFASWWLARHLSAPIRRIQAGARALASERLGMPTAGMRVSAGFEGRKDELAVLARDFDAMADHAACQSRGITRLLRDISHELRSPLARMRVAVGLARQPPAMPGGRWSDWNAQIERLDSLISQVLKLARLHGSDAHFEREEFDLDEVIEQVVRDANYEGAVKGCSVRLSGAAHTKINGNRELLGSAVENVLRNAVRYSPVGMPVDVSIERPASSGSPAAGLRAGALWIVIRDRGPGVPAGDLERIF